jgi:hypothetical protein
VTQPQCRNKSGPDVTAQGIDGDTRIDDHHTGGAQGRQSPDRSSEGVKEAESKGERGRVLASVSPKWRKLFVRGWSGSRKAAIRGHCLQCCGFSPQAVTLCSDYACLFFEFRRKG